MSDAVNGLVALADCPRAHGEIVNVGSDEELSVLDLARRVLSAHGGPGDIELVPFERVYGPGFRDPSWRRPDLTRIRSWTGWRPQRSLDDAVYDVLSAVALTRR